MLSYKNTAFELAESGIDTVIVSVGATEQFGPFLPMHLDSLIAERYAEAFGKALNAYILPGLPFNTSEEHAGFKGTVTVSPNVLTAMVEEIMVNLSKQGFNKFILCSGHGGSYWEGAFIKHFNYKYPDLVLMHAHHNQKAWEQAIKAAKLEGLNEIHGGLLSVCTAMWLCPELVHLKSMGSYIAPETRMYADFMGWEKLTIDGCWGHFEEGTYNEEELSEKGRIFWTTFIDEKCKDIKEVLAETQRLKLTNDF
jgi:creatinine amidohydrolase